MAKENVTSNKHSATGRIKNRLHIHTVFFILLVLLLSTFYLYYEWQFYNGNAASEAIKLAQSVEALMHPEHILGLSGSDADLQTPEYDMAKTSLMRLTRANSAIQSAYILGEFDGNTVYLLDSELPGAPDYSPPGQSYGDAAKTRWKSILSGESVITSQTTDKSGSVISVFVPMRESGGGRVIAVLGFDYSAAGWRAAIWKNMLPDIVIVVCVLLICLSLLRILLQHFRFKELNRRLTHNEALYRSVFEQTPVGIAIVNDKTFVLQAAYGQVAMNCAFETILGRSKQELAGLNWPDITHPDDLAADLEKFDQFKAGKINGYTMEKRFIRPDGTSVWTKMKVGRLMDIEKDYPMHLCLLEDISESKAISDTLRESERSKTVLIANLPGMAYRCDYDPDWTMRFISEGCYDLTGYRPESLIDNKELSYNEVISPEYRKGLWERWSISFDERLPFKCEYEITTADGKRKWVLEMGQGVFDQDGNVVALEGIILDISDRKQMENQLRYYNEHDSLTGLYRRNYLVARLEKGAATQRRALVGINLSTIQSLNVTYGFQYTQNLTKRIAGLLEEECNENRVLFKIYEAQFAYLITNYNDPRELMEFCRAIAGKLEAELTLERIGGGIGVLEIPEDSQPDADEIIKKLMVISERAIGPGSYNYNIGIYFNDKEIEAQISREEEIRRVLTRIAESDGYGELYLQYQPIYDLKSGKITEFEALARMKTEKLGFVLPLEFIHIAEKTKLIVPVGYKIIRLALGFLKRLKESGYDDINISVNISAIQLLKPDFPVNLLRIIDEMQVDPANIGIELTESIFASDFDEINRIISELRAQKIQIAIDDFGTGYSTLARERELYVDCLKIDKSFIDKLKTENPQNTMTADIISIAHKMGHCVIAEGVECRGQIKYLYKYGCEKIQGYLISRPQSEDKAIELLGREFDISDVCGTYCSGGEYMPQQGAELPGWAVNQIRSILDSTAEAIYGIDLEGNCTFCNKSCIRLLGYESAGDLLGRNMHQLIHHSYPDGTPMDLRECRIFQSINEGRGYDVDEEVFWRADGTPIEVEYHSYPQISKGITVGGVITFLDISERKKRDEWIKYLSLRDTLTALNNRNSFEKALQEMDTVKNLPLSVIFADINGLKMTNDIFGHNSGDRLLRKAAEILKESCREEDFIARVGGDEFVIIMPNTDAAGAEAVIKRIRRGFEHAQVEAIKCSTSIGFDTKTTPAQSIEITLSNAENAMYRDKTINRQSVSREIINTIIETLHTKKPDERDHSIAVSELCGLIGAALNLPKNEIAKLKRAGYLHDIGKIVIDDDILKKSPLTNEEEEKMRPHVVTGYRILNLFDDTLDLTEAVYAHHERWDGTGYPLGLRGEQIPLISRIIAIAECFDRWAKLDGYSDEAKKSAIKIIMLQSGHRFDPHIAEIVYNIVNEDIAQKGSKNGSEMALT